MTHENAIQFCISWGGKLFEPKTPEANSEVNNLAKAQGLVWYWLGINDVSEEGNFVYNSDGKAIGWTNWASGQPDNLDASGLSADCGSQNIDSPDYTIGWHDANCNDLTGFVCEKIV